MNRTGACPVCNESFGLLQAGDTRSVYYHTDLTDRKVYCVERADGEHRERVESSVYPQRPKA